MQEQQYVVKVINRFGKYTSTPFPESKVKEVSRMYLDGASVTMQLSYGQVILSREILSKSVIVFQKF